MNPLNRRMFRQPGMSRQPAGILASSPQLANTVANRQPVRMANGGTNTYTAAVQRAVQAGDKRSIQELSKPSNYGDAARTPDAQNALRMATQALGKMTQISTAPSVAPRSVGSYVDQGIAAAKNVGRILTTPTDDLPMSNLIASGQLPDELTGATSSKDQNVMDGGAPRFNPDGMSSQEDLGRGSRESDLMGSKEDTQFFGPGETLSNEIVDFEISPDKKDAGDDEDGNRLKSLIPIPKPKPKREASKENLMGTDQDAQFMQDPLNIVDMVASAQNDPENKTEKDKAKATDSILNIKSIKERKKFLREILGESKAKDIRTDANYNLMMTGLMIAAGESPDALVNISKGLAGGLKGYGDAVGEEAKEERKIDRELGLLAYQDVEKREAADRAADAAEKSELRKIEAAATEGDKQRVFLTSQNSLSFLNKKELAELGFTNQLKIAELSTNSRELIAELGRENQMEIAKLPSKEIQGLLDIFGGDREAVKAYLERKKSTSGPQAKSGERKADDLEELITKDESRIRRIRGELQKRNGRKPTEAEIQAEIRTIARAGIADFLPKTDDGNTSDTPGGFTVTKQK